MGQSAGVGFPNTALIEHWDGKKWSVVASPAERARVKKAREKEEEEKQLPEMAVERSVDVATVAPVVPMAVSQDVTPEEVAAMLRLSALGWGSKRIAAEFGCSRATVKRYLELEGWVRYRRARRHGPERRLHQP